MHFTCIRFSRPEGPPETKSTLLLKLAASLLTLIIPRANPDFDGMIDEVEEWLVECETVSGIPNREIGLDASGTVIMKMPCGNNYGYWIDNNLLLPHFMDTFDAKVISPTEFEAFWNQFPD